MDNPFKALESKETIPEHLKKEVMSSINLSQLILDVSDLFLGKMGDTITGLFKTDQK